MKFITGIIPTSLVLDDLTTKQREKNERKDIRYIERDSTIERL